MIKFWTEGKQIIAFAPKVILYGTYSTLEIERFKHSLERGYIPNELTGININYVKAVTYDPRKFSISFELGKGSQDEIIIKDKRLREEVFVNIQKTYNTFNYKKASPNKLWRKFTVELFLILIFFFQIWSSSINYTGSGTMIGRTVSATLKLIQDNLTKPEILLLGFIVLSWRVINHGFNIKALQKTKQLQRIQ